MASAKATDPPEEVKLVVVGDGCVGKTTMLITHVFKEYPSDYIPTVFDNYVHEEEVDGKAYRLGFWDTAGGEDYWRLRPLSYPRTNVFLLCFAVDSHDSFENIRTMWIPELRSWCPDVPVLLCANKIDLRDNEHFSDQASRERKYITYEEGLALAEKVDASYVETSSLKNEGLQECFEGTIRLGTSHLHGCHKPRWWNPLFGHSRGFPKLWPPPIPPKYPSPNIKVEKSRFVEDWDEALQEYWLVDIIFVMEETEKLPGHSIIFAAASELFAQILAHQPLDTESSSQSSSSCKEGSKVTWSDVNTGKVEGLTSIKQDEGFTEICLSAEITAEIFKKCLNFIYTGRLEKSDEVDVSTCVPEVVKVARMLNLPHLVSLCENFENKDVIGMTHCRELGSKLRDMFLNKALLADVTFLVEDEKIYAHKVVLISRSDYMSAMLSGNFAEGREEKVSEIRLPDVTVESFLAFLDYLYSDQPALESCKDMKAVISLADRYCHPRFISVCERFIADELERQCRAGIETVTIDVIDFLQFSKIYNAHQLPQYCLHFIAVHYLEFSIQGKLRALDSKEREYVERHRWPPESYVKALEKYDRKKKSQLGKKSDKCVIT